MTAGNYNDGTTVNGAGVDGRSINTTVVRGLEACLELEPEWRRLVERCPRATVFQSLPWHVSWWRAFGRGHELLVVLGFGNGRLVGIAPMMVAREPGSLGRERRVLRFIGGANDASDYCDFIVDPAVPEALDALLEALCTAAAPVQRIELSHLPAGSPNQARALDFFARRGFASVLEFQAEAPVRILGDRDADTKAANKTSLKRHTASFRRAGELKFHRCTSADEIRGHLDAFFAQHIGRWAHTGAPSQFLDPAQRRFYAELVTALFPEGCLRFDVVLFNGAPLAFHFGFECDKRFLWYKPAFDIRFASSSPGEVLIKFLLEDAIRGDLEEFDFTIGSEPFKYRFANHVRHVNRLTAFGSRFDYWNHRAKGLLRNLARRRRGRPATAVPGAPMTAPGPKRKA